MGPQKAHDRRCSSLVEVTDDTLVNHGENPRPDSEGRDVADGRCDEGAFEPARHQCARTTFLLDHHHEWRLDLGPQPADQLELGEVAVDVGLPLLPVAPNRVQVGQRFDDPDVHAVAFASSRAAVQPRQTWMWAAPGG